jgi:hypothetical protein
MMKLPANRLHSASCSAAEVAVAGAFWVMPDYG